MAFVLIFDVSIASFPTPKSHKCVKGFLWRTTN